MRRTKVAGLAAGAVLMFGLVGCGVGTEEGAWTPGDGGRYGASTTVIEVRGEGPVLCLGSVQESYPPGCGGLPVVGWDWGSIDHESAVGTRWTDAYVEGTYDGERLTLTTPPQPPRWPEREPGPGPACETPEVVDPEAGGRDFGSHGVAEADLVSIWVSDPGDEMDQLNPDWDGPFIVSLMVRPGATERARQGVRRVWSGHLCIVERDQPTEAELLRIQSRIGDVLPDALSWGPETRRGVVSVLLVVVDERSQRAVDEEFGAGMVELHGALTPID